MFNIAAVRYSLRDRALEVYVSGCLGEQGYHCKNCHNPELWDPDYGFSYESMFSLIKDRINEASKMINSIRIYGGELLEKPEEEVLKFLKDLSIFNKELWLFTRFDINRISNRILKCVDYIKCGQYIEELSENVEYYGVTLATSNQKIYKKGVDF